MVEVQQGLGDPYNQDPMPRPPRRQDRTPNDASATASSATGGPVNDELFLEPMMGTPLAIYIEKDVTDRDQLIEIITVSPSSLLPVLSRPTLSIERVI